MIAKLSHRAAGVFAAATALFWSGIATAQELADPQGSGAIVGAVRWLQMRGSVDIGPGGERLLAGVVVDVTPLMSTQQALEASREELRRLATYRESEREQEYRRLAREFHGPDRPPWTADDALPDQAGAIGRR